MYLNRITGWRGVLVSGCITLLVSAWLLSPVWTKAGWQKESAAQVPEGADEAAVLHPGLLPLQREILWNESLILLSEEDSMHMGVNLADTTVSLYLQGVPVYRIPVTRFSIDPLLKGMPARAYLKTFGRPFPVTDRTATIIREPIVVREAPESQEEAEISAWAPDTLIQQPAFFRLVLDNGIDLVVMQDEVSTFRDRLVRARFLTGLRLERSVRFFHYRPRITLQIPAQDVRAFYRALPQCTEVALNYPLKIEQSDET